MAIHAPTPSSPRRRRRKRGTAGASARAQAALGALLVPLLLWALAGTLAGTLTGCGGGGQPDLPDFPRYEQADAFLEMQARLKAQQPPPPPPSYTDRNELIYENMRGRIRASSAELEWRAQQRTQKRYESRAANQAEFEAMQQRLARDEALDALRGRQRAENGRAIDAGSRARYQGYQSRLEQLARRQEDIARQQELNRFRHQERVAGALEELDKNRELTLRLQQQESQQASGATN